jgi:hypothetical protein
LIDEGGSGVGTGLLSQFNAEIQGFRGVSNKGLIVIAATNYPEKLPPAGIMHFISFYSSVSFSKIYPSNLYWVTILGQYQRNHHEKAQKNGLE